MSWLRQCADWLAYLDADSYPPAVNLRPSADWPDRAVVAVDLARVRAVIDRVAAVAAELARAWRVEDLGTGAVLPDRRAERRRRLAEPDLEFRAFCARKGLPVSSALQGIRQKQMRRAAEGLKGAAEVLEEIAARASQARRR